MTKNTAARQNLWQPEDDRPKKKKKPPTEAAAMVRVLKVAMKPKL